MTDDRWISVEERFPPAADEDGNSEWVLGWVTDLGGYCACVFLAYDESGKPDFWDDDASIIDLHRVSHWMELPGDPMEQEKEN